MYTWFNDLIYSLPGPLRDAPTHCTKRISLNELSTYVIDSIVEHTIPFCLVNLRNGKQRMLLTVLINYFSSSYYIYKAGFR